MSLRQPWTQKVISFIKNQEDQILTSLVKKYGTSNWILISEKMQTKANTYSRTGKQCRERWHNHLDPLVSKKSWSYQEEQKMFEAHRKYGNKWAQIAAQLENRTDNDVKNHFYAVIRKCLRRISKIFGQKNSTEKIKNLKPSTLSNLLQNSNNKASKCKNHTQVETSEALFKFILSRENLNVESMEKKVKKILQGLIEKITTDQLIQKQKSTDLKKSQDINSCSDQQNQSQNQIFKKPLKSTNSQEKFSRSSMNNNKPTIKQNKTKILKKKNSKINKKHELQKYEEKNRVELEGKQIIMPFQNKSLKKSSAFQSFSPSLSFKWVEQNDRKVSFNGQNYDLKQLSGEDKSFLSEFSIPETPDIMRTRSSYGKDLYSILSNNDKRTIYVTPKNPTPGNSQNLFISWNLPQKLTSQQIENEREKIRKQILKNIQEL